MSAPDQPKTEQQTQDETQQMLDLAMRVAGFNHKLRRYLAPLYWAVLLFSGIGWLFELAIVLRVFRSPLRKAQQWVARRMSPIDPVAHMESQPAGITESAAWKSGEAHWTLRQKIAKRVYEVLVGPFDSLVFHTTHAFDPYPSKPGTAYRPFNTFPEFTLQGLITLAAATALFLDYAPGLILTDSSINLYCAAGLIYQFLAPVLFSKRMVKTFPSALMNLKLAAAIAVLAYVGALILAKLTFAPVGSIQWTADGVTDWLTRMTQELWPKSLTDLRAMVEATGLPQVWPGLAALLPLLPAVLAVLFSLGAIKLGTTAIFLKRDDDSYFFRGMHFLEAGQTGPARIAFEKIANPKTRGVMLLIPPLIEEDDQTFEARVQDHGHAQFGPFARLQPHIALCETLLLLDRQFNLDIHRYPLAARWVIDRLHPALAAHLFLPIPDSFANFLDRLLFQHQQATDATGVNPSVFPTALFKTVEREDGGLALSLELSSLRTHLEAKPNQNIPPLDQFGCVSYALTMLGFGDLSDILSDDDLTDLRDCMLACAARLYDMELPLGHEFEELFIKTLLCDLRDPLSLPDRPELRTRPTRNLLDDLLLRNIAQSQIKQDQTGPVPGITTLH